MLADLGGRESTSPIVGVSVNLQSMTAPPGTSSDACVSGSWTQDPRHVDCAMFYALLRALAHNPGIDRAHVVPRLLAAVEGPQHTGVWVARGLQTLARELRANGNRRLVVVFDEFDEIQGVPRQALLTHLNAAHTHNALYPDDPGNVLSVVLVGLGRLDDDNGDATGGLPPDNTIHFAEDIRAPPMWGVEQISRLYAQHVEASGQRFAAGVCERVHWWTAGQPWLVNRLAQVMSTELHAGEEEVPVQAVDTAVNVMVKRHESHLDSLENRMHDNRLRRVAEAIVRGESIGAGTPDARYALDLGIVAASGDDRSVCTFANRMYARVIPGRLARMERLRQRRAERSAPATRLEARPVRTDGTPDVEHMVDTWTLVRYRVFLERHAEMGHTQPMDEQIVLQGLEGYMSGVVCDRGRVLPIEQVVERSLVVEHEAFTSRRCMGLLMLWPRGRRGAEQRVALEATVCRLGAMDAAARERVLQAEARQCVTYMRRARAHEGFVVVFDAGDDPMEGGGRGDGVLRRDMYVDGWHVRVLVYRTGGAGSGAGGGGAAAGGAARNASERT